VAGKEILWRRAKRGTQAFRGSNPLPRTILLVRLKGEKLRKAVGTSVIPSLLGDEDRGVKILEELSNGTPWNTIAKKYQISTRTISEMLSHRHCPVCGTPVFMFEQFCGPICEGVFRRAQRRREYVMLLQILLIFPFLLLILLLGHR